MSCIEITNCILLLSVFLFVFVFAFFRRQVWTSCQSLRTGWTSSLTPWSSPLLWSRSNLPRFGYDDWWQTLKALEYVNIFSWEKILSNLHWKRLLKTNTWINVKSCDVQWWITLLNIAGVEDKHSVQRHNKTARRHQAQRPHVPTGGYQINISTTPIILIITWSILILSMWLQVVTAHIISESQANSLLRAGHSHTKKTRWKLS